MKVSAYDLYIHPLPVSLFTTAMSLFKLSMLLFSSISFHLALGSPPSPDPEDKIMVISIRERIWRHAGAPSTLFLKVLLL